MVYYDRIDLSEGIDVHKSNKSNNSNKIKKECMICHYSYCLDGSCKHEPKVCDELENIVILNIEGVYYRCVI